ncbi:MAG: OmpA family protein [Bacteroidales bacterium]|nr:OmpA family protein [Bacteroidales bacterium]
MLKHSISIVLLLIMNYGLAQNLVPNPSFEDRIDFKSKSGDWFKCLKSDTPDYFYFDSLTKQNHIFETYLGNVKPRTGNACIGLFFYRKHKYKNSRNIREYIQVNLLEPLEKDSLYLFEFYIWLDIESNIAIKDFAVFFSPERIYYKSNKDIFQIKPQIIYNSNFVTEKANWTKISGLYKAQGNENYMVIGSFSTDNKLKKMRLKESAQDENKINKWDTKNREYISYYYMDDVSLALTDITSNEEMNMQEDIFSEINDSEFIDKADEFEIENIHVDSVVVLKNILFEFNKDEIQPISYNELNKLLTLLKNNPELKIDIYGHTDNIGKEKYNQNLSEKRAKAVFNFLIKNGIEESRLTFKGYGSSVPIKSNNSEEERKLNRRVEFKVTEK